MILKFIELVESIETRGMKVAEIGVFKGESTIVVLPIIGRANGSYVAVDTWEYAPPTEFNNIVEPWKDICTTCTGISWEVANQFPDEYFDLVFIDAAHGYSSVIRDIKAWMPKVKSGGILSGHDYNPAWDGTDKNIESDSSHFGVTKAVHEVLGTKIHHEGFPSDCEVWWVNK